MGLIIWTQVLSYKSHDLPDRPKRFPGRLGLKQSLVLSNLANWTNWTKGDWIQGNLEWCFSSRIKLYYPGLRSYSELLACIKMQLAFDSKNGGVAWYAKRHQGVKEESSSPYTECTTLLC